MTRNRRRPFVIAVILTCLTAGVFAWNSTTAGPLTAWAYLRQAITFVAMLVAWQMAVVSRPVTPDLSLHDEIKKARR